MYNKIVDILGTISEIRREIEALRDAPMEGRPRKSLGLPRRRKGLHSLQPNNGETYLLGVLNELNPRGWAWSGDGSTTIGNMRPDFISTNGENSVIELFGNWCHPLEEVEEKVRRYKELGYTCLVVWTEELHDKEKLVDHIIKGYQYCPSEDTLNKWLPRTNVKELRSKIPNW